jgi:hypothetical protein
VSRLFNESRPPEPPLPKLVAGRFVILCAPTHLDERVARIKTSGLAHLRIVTELLATPTD